MKYVSVIILLVCVGIFAGVTAYDYERLPEKVVSRFDGTGQPTSWTNKGSFFLIMVLVGLGLPILPMACMYGMRFLPPSWANLPTYWKEPANYQRLCRFLFQTSLWYSAGFLLWQTAFGHMVANANLASPPQLNSVLMLAACLALLLLTTAWLLVLVLAIVRVDGKAAA